MTTKKLDIVAAAASILLFGGLLFTASPAHAQFAGQTAGARIFLFLSPEYPGPNEPVRISLESTLIDLARSEIVWYVNNKVFKQGIGVKDADILVGPLGSKTGISVTAQTPDGENASGVTVISPAEVDLLWESDSYVPPFYRGRALPSHGTSVRMHAIARFRPAGSAQIPENNILYTWKRNGSTVGSASGRGRSSVIFPSPALFSTDIIEVNAAAADGTGSGTGRAQISSIEPVLALYQNHPLFGIMYHRAFDGTIALLDTEATFSAVPYFAEAESPDDARLIYSWNVNGNDIPADVLKPSELTVNAGKSNGLAQIALSITHAANLAMRSSGEWSAAFGANDNVGFTGISPFDALSE